MHLKNRMEAHVNFRYGPTFAFLLLNKFNLSTHFCFAVFEDKSQISSSTASLSDSLSLFPVFKVYIPPPQPPNMLLFCNYILCSSWRTKISWLYLVDIKAAFTHVFISWPSILIIIVKQSKYMRSLIVEMHQ